MVVWVVGIEGSIIITVRVILTAGFLMEVVDTIAVRVVTAGVIERHTRDGSRVIVLRIRESNVWGMA